MKGRFTVLMIVALAVGVLVSTGHAALTVQVTDGTTTLTVADGDASDLNVNSGVVSLIDSVGVWEVDVATGRDAYGLGIVRMHLNSSEVSSGGAGTLWVKLSDTDFSPDPSWSGANVISSFSTTTDGTVTSDQYLGTGNTLWETAGGPVVSFGPFVGPGSFGDDAITSVGLITSSFSLTEVVEIVHTGANQNTSFDADIQVVPVPAAVLLGFLGLGAAGLKLRRFA